MANYSIKVGDSFYVRNSANWFEFVEFVATHTYKNGHGLSKPNWVASYGFHFSLANVYSLKQVERMAITEPLITITKNTNGAN